VALRSRIVLACADGKTNGEVAQACGVNSATVSKWRRRFAADRLEGLVDAPRPGAARTVADETVEAVVVDALESAPADATHWSTRGLADKYGISKTTVVEMWPGVRAQTVAGGQLQGVSRPRPGGEGP
jgi:transposase